MPQQKKWLIQWRGTITRDVGREQEYADTADEARTQYHERYPMREIVSIKLSE